jgi:hypothetical protein
MAPANLIGINAMPCGNEIGAASGPDHRRDHPFQVPAGHCVAEPME